MSNLVSFDYLTQPGTADRYVSSMPAMEKRIWTIVRLPGNRAIDMRPECVSGFWELNNPTKESFMLVHDACLYKVAWGLLVKGTVTIYPEKNPYKRKVLDAVGVKCYTIFPEEFVNSHITPSMVSPYSDVGRFFKEVM